MPSFSFLDSVEQYLRAGKLPASTSKSAKKVTRAASKNFIFKGGSLWRSYRGRLLRVVRSEEEMREVLTRYHDNNNHAGRVRAVKEIMMMYYWVGVTDSVKRWISSCSVCQSRSTSDPPVQPVLSCLVYGCDASSYSCPDLSFHRFPKEAERRRRWLAVAQRDEGSLRVNSHLCSQHFEPSCYTLSEDGRLALLPDAVPTIIPAVKEDEVPVPSDEDFLQSGSLDDLLSTAAAAAETVDPSEQLSFSHPETPTGLQEHQYSLRASEPDAEEAQSSKRRNAAPTATAIEPTFTIYNHIARYLSHRIVPTHIKKSRGAFKRMAKRFGLIDGVLMYTRVSPPLRVPRSREEVNSILQQFHNNQGHYGQGLCQREISKHFYWTSMTRDLARWISSCHACVHRTKRKWLRCSVYNCTNCCGPVERGLGLTFHKFPLHNPSLLAQWLKAIGRPSWHPRLWSSVCSTHFSLESFDRSGDGAELRPDAVPSLTLHGQSATQPAQAAAGEEVFFAKYDAVELYLSRHTYPPGLNYVEKNTFRRFCKKFIIKDGDLQVLRGDQARLVLRNRQQVEAALTDYHDELNHLDVNKCLRLLNERYFWKTMRSDVVQWINNCSHCSRKKGRRPEGRVETSSSSPPPPELVSPQHHLDSLHEEEEECCGDEGGGSDRDTEEQLESTTLEKTTIPPVPPRTPILVRLQGPASSQTSHALRPQQPLSAAPPSSSGTPPQRLEPQTRSRTGASQPGATQPPSEAQTPAPGPLGASKSQTPPQRSAKRRREPDPDPAARRAPSCGLEPVVAPSTKPWPVFTIAGPAQVQPDKPRPKVDSDPAVFGRSRKLQARCVLQQCSRARLKTKPALDGAEAQWTEIEEGMVAYVCFLQGATEDVSFEMANSLMTLRLFRKDSGHSVSLLDLPGSVLLIPQDSLAGERVSGGRRLQVRGGCEQWWGAQLFSSLVSTCRELLAASAKCTRAGARVEQGVYGQKQEIVLTSSEPLTTLLDF